MELIKYIQTVGNIIPNSLKALSELKLNDIKYNFAKGEDEYPKTMKEAYKKFKTLWRKKL